MTTSFDHIVIGGGIFGAYSALYSAKRGCRVALLEKESSLFSKASLVNQARLHGGYHYPRSIATALMSDENKTRFTNEHRDFINFSFEKYYAIDRFASFTDAKQFERFCAYIDLKCEKVAHHPLFNYERLEALYLTEEYSFDPVLIGHHYKKQLLDTPNIELFLNSEIEKVEQKNQTWQIFFNGRKAETTSVVNATYSASNAINRLFGLHDINLMHEISEMCFVSSPQFAGKGITIMDGQFASMMPYGLSGLLSLSSVAYTHHKVSYDNLPSFDCQSINRDCRPNFTSNCNACYAKPVSAKEKMLAQIRQYLGDTVQLNYFSNFFTIKSKLKANHIDDGRPTEIAHLHQNPSFFCLFAGKINSIYEIEKVI